MNEKIGTLGRFAQYLLIISGAFILLISRHDDSAKLLIYSFVFFELVHIFYGWQNVLRTKTQEVYQKQRVLPVVSKDPEFGREWKRAVLKK